MKAHLLYRDRDFDMEQELPPSAPALTQDLALNTLFSAMACDDKFVFQVAKHAVLSGLQDDLETILYRQAVLKDCLRNHSIVETIYDVAVEALESKKKQWWFGFSKHFPSGTLHGAVVLLQMLMGMLGKLKRLADEHSDKFESEGFTAFFAMLKAELADDYFASVKAHLKELKFRQGVLVSAELGKGNEGTNYVLRKPLGKESWWIERILPRRRRAYTFRIADRDEGGARALGELRDRGINLAANALAQSTDHILSFFVMLQRELASRDMQSKEFENMSVKDFGSALDDKFGISKDFGFMVGNDKFGHQIGRRDPKKKADRKTQYDAYKELTTK